MLQALFYVFTTNLHCGKVCIVIRDFWDFQKNIPNGCIVAHTGNMSQQFHKW